MGGSQYIDGNGGSGGGIINVLDGHVDLYTACSNIIQSATTTSDDGILNSTIVPSLSSRRQELLDCITTYINDTQQTRLDLIHYNQNKNRNLHVLLAACVVFFMQTGFAMVCAGAVRKKNLHSTMMKNLLDACGSAIAYFLVGYAFAFGSNGSGSGTSFVGTSGFLLLDVDTNLSFWIFQYTFSATTATIVAGTLAERCQMVSYFLYSSLLAGFVYPVVVHAIWHEDGFLSSSIMRKQRGDDLFLDVGVIDIAGSGVVHVCGGICALAATYVLGPRRGRFHDIQTGEILPKPTLILGHSMALQVSNKERFIAPRFDFGNCLFCNFFLIMLFNALTKSYAFPLHSSLVHSFCGLVGKIFVLCELHCYIFILQKR